VSDPVALATLVLEDAPGSSRPERQDHGAYRSGAPDQCSDSLRDGACTEAGQVLFFDDIYGYDRKLERQLGLPPVSLMPVRHP